MFQGPLCLVAIVSVVFALKLPAKEYGHWQTKIRRVDFLGATVLILAVFALLLGLDRGSNDRWRSPLAIVPTCLFIPLAALFLYIEFRVAAEPIAPKRIVLSRSLAACYLCNFFAFAAWMAILFYLPLYYQAVLKYSSSEAGLGLLPAILASVAGSLIGGLIMQRTGKYYWMTSICYVMSSLGVIPVVLCAGLVVQNTVGIGIGLVLSGFGNGGQYCIPTLHLVLHSYISRVILPSPDFSDLAHSGRHNNSHQSHRQCSTRRPCHCDGLLIFVPVFWIGHWTFIGIDYRPAIIADSAAWSVARWRADRRDCTARSTKPAIY